MKDLPENIVADRHEVSGKWCFMYLTDEQAEKCFHALKPSYSVGVKTPRRSAEMHALEKMQVGESKTAADRDQAQRLRVYLCRIFGTGAGAYRAVNGHYRVTRVK